MAKAFQSARKGKHAAVIEEVLAILTKHFSDDFNAEGYQKDGPVAVAKFELGEDVDLRDHRILRQREACNVIMQLLETIG